MCLAAKSFRQSARSENETSALRGNFSNSLYNSFSTVLHHENIRPIGTVNHMTRTIRLFANLFTATAFLFSASMSNAQTDKPADQIRIGLQKSSTLTAVLRANGELDKALAPLGVKVSWHEFSSGLPLLESLGVGNLDFGADVADTVPIFAQAAGSKLAYVAEESASPAAQGCEGADAPATAPVGAVDTAGAAEEMGASATVI